MAITPNYRRFVPLQVNQPKNIKEKSTENPNSEQVSNNSGILINDSSTNGTSIYPLAVQSTIKSAEQQIAALEIKINKISERLSQVKSQIEILKNQLVSSNNSENVSKLKDLQAEQESLEIMLDVLNREKRTIETAMNALIDNYKSTPNNNDPHIIQW